MMRIAGRRRFSAGIRISVGWNVAGLSGGVYFALLQAGSARKIIKMLISFPWLSPANHLYEKARPVNRLY
ncbi:MAG: hypothetical protein GXO75_09610 [Calditrichaeota bacterium]|nr:hypothetical protein [Calditrichota bacterium]